MFHILFHTCFIRVSYHTIARPDIHPSIGGGMDPFSDGLGLRDFRICLSHFQFVIINKPDFIYA